MSFQLLTTPSSIGRVLDSGFKLFTSSFKSVLGLVILSAVISVIMQYAMTVVMVPDQPLITAEQSQEYMSQAIPVLMVVGTVFWVFSIAIYNMVLARVGQLAMNEAGDLTDAIIKGVKKLSSLTRRETEPHPLLLHLQIREKGWSDRLPRDRQ